LHCSHIRDYFLMVKMLLQFYSLLLFYSMFPSS
jgi:hypothetical protein